MNKKRKYLLLLSKLIAEKIMTKDNKHIKVDIKLSVLDVTATISITFLNKEHENFTIFLYEFYGPNELKKLRKEIFSYLNNDALVLDLINLNKKEFMLYDFKKGK